VVAGVLLALALSGVVYAAVQQSLFALLPPAEQPPTQPADSSTEGRDAEGWPPAGPAPPAAGRDSADRSKWRRTHRNHGQLTCMRTGARCGPHASHKHQRWAWQRGSRCQPPRQARR
jgi:hypothetical protein